MTMEEKVGLVKEQELDGNWITVRAVCKAQGPIESPKMEPLL